MGATNSMLLQGMALQISSGGRDTIWRDARRFESVPAVTGKSTGPAFRIAPQAADVSGPESGAMLRLGPAGPVPVVRGRMARRPRSGASPRTVETGMTFRALALLLSTFLLSASSAFAQEVTVGVLSR